MLAFNKRCCYCLTKSVLVWIDGVLPPGFSEIYPLLITENCRHTHSYDKFFEKLPIFDNALANFWKTHPCLSKIRQKSYKEFPINVWLARFIGSISKNSHVAFPSSISKGRNPLIFVPSPLSMVGIFCSERRSS